MKRKEMIALILSCVLVLPIAWGAYWVAKHISYSMFYRDMVEQTVREMVKDSALNSSPGPSGKAP